ncbi:MAG: transposase [Isosphaeraceae bacterium]
MSTAQGHSIVKTLRKGALKAGAAIIFIDATGFSFRCRPGTTWAPTGRTPVLRRVSKRREVSTAVALTLSGRIYKRHFDHAIHGPDVVVFLRHLQRYHPGPLMVIWDRLQAHRSADVKGYRAQHPEIMVEELPTYAPDLNPEEGCHGDVKRHLLNATPEDTRQIRKQANRGFARLRRRPDLILAFFHHADYRVKRLT